MKFSLHQQHLAGAFDDAAEAALVVRREASVFAGENAPLVGDELAEEVGVLEVEGVDGEINFGLGARSALFHGARTAAAVFAVAFFCVRFAWHKSYLISLCTVWRRSAGLNFLISMRSVWSFLFLVVV